MSVAILEETEEEGGHRRSYACGYACAYAPVRRSSLDLLTVVAAPKQSSVSSREWRRAKDGTSKEGRRESNAAPKRTTDDGRIGGGGGCGCLTLLLVPSSIVHPSIVRLPSSACRPARPHAQSGRGRSGGGGNRLRGQMATSRESRAMAETGTHPSESTSRIGFHDFQLARPKPRILDLAYIEAKAKVRHTCDCADR